MLFKFKHLIILFANLVAFAGFSQSKRTNIWYFGYGAGLSFNSSPPVALTDAKINVWEGCASLCDDDGNLLMYSDGEKIWNRNHEVMPGATALGGSNSSTQSGIFVPKPGDENIIYVFSVYEEWNRRGLQYAIVDMRLNGGLGGLVSKNNQLLTPAAEKITAIPHCNGVDYWIISHDQEDNFYTWLLTKDGIGTPQITKTGSNHKGHRHSAIGYMKASPDGTKLALANYHYGFFEFFDFDKSNGFISNPILIKNTRTNDAYGLEFSPNNKYIYLATTQRTNNIIYQMDLSHWPSAENLTKSMVEIGLSTGSYFGALQLGPDGKIYAAKEKELDLGVINNPNLPGSACGFVEKGVYLQKKRSGSGLPNLIPSFLVKQFKPEIEVIRSGCGMTRLKALPDTLPVGEYKWFKNGILISGAGSSVYEPQSEGEYYVSIFNQAECARFPVNSTPVNLAKNDVSPANISIQFQTKALTCSGKNDATITAQVSGGEVPYTYKWLSGQTTGSIQNLGPGNYTLQVTDKNGCSTEKSITIGTIEPIAISGIIKDAGCDKSNGEIMLDVKGGIAPYTYLWSPGNLTGKDIKAIKGGKYKVVVTDKNGCSLEKEFEVKTIAAISVQVNARWASCGKDNGALNLVVDGGNPPYSFKWSNNNSTSKDLENIPAGNYSVTVTDQAGCSVNVSGVVGEDAPITISETLQDAGCENNNGSIKLDVKGGIGNYNYVWNPGNYTGPDLSGLPAGNYSVIVTDAAGCSVTGNYTITKSEKPVISAQVRDATCNGKDGSVTLHVTSGIAPYSYQWDPGNYTTRDLMNVAAGIYSVTVTDLSGCIQKADVTVGRKNIPLNVIVSATPALCFGESSGSAEVSVSNGLAPYSYSWSNNQTGNPVTGLLKGNYSITVTDSRGCTGTAETVIHEPPALELVLNKTDPKCINNGSITALVQGGTSPYNYMWPVQNLTTPQLTNLGAGRYTLEVTDANGCKKSATENLVLYTMPRTVLPADTFMCPGERMILNPGNYDSYLWQDGYTQQQYTVTSPGMYEVTVSNGPSCTEKVRITVKEDCGNIYISNAFTPNGDGLNDVFGPSGNLNAIKDFRMVIFNRFGQTVFESGDPRIKWNGFFKGSINPGTYTYSIVYTLQSSRISKKGTVTLIR